ncbi:Flp family type IVb pilin [Nocardioides carbamazepini]|uniref:Flp family type IVb pilin n=1 Tax=Nocardioides carbamazepini TaxID=2854259 RepID=UPI00214A5B85|nr:Flp family type IVb pilin [Nocardioides carbamazepini]MCR1781678.1 Flp family type IVb pilin [Nocardioides carbamazepini]
MIQYLNILLNARLAKMEERGATAVEYGLLVALIAAVIIGAVVILGGKLNGAFDTVNDSLENVPASD